MRKLFLINLIITLAALALTDCRKTDSIAEVMRSRNISADICADGHAFGSKRGTFWEGWYYDTTYVGDDLMLRGGLVGEDSLMLDRFASRLTIALGDPDAVDKLRSFLSPLPGFRRFYKRYEEGIDSVVDEEYGFVKYVGYYTFTIEYADSSVADRDRINRIIYDMCGVSGENIDPGLGTAADVERISDLSAENQFDFWKEYDSDPFMSSSAADVSIRPYVVNDRYMTIGIYDFERFGTGHGSSVETFHTIDLNIGQELGIDDIFTPGSLNEVKMRLFETIGEDPKFYRSNDDPMTPAEVERVIREWQTGSMDDDSDYEFVLPGCAMLDTGVLFSFQTGEIDCMAAGVPHYLVPYTRLRPYLTTYAQSLLDR